MRCSWRSLRVKSQELKANTRLRPFSHDPPVPVFRILLVHYTTLQSLPPKTMGLRFSSPRNIYFVMGQASFSKAHGRLQQ